MTENMKLWDAVCKTDPAHTKKVNQRGGFTTIDAMYQIQEATRAFGAAGVGWGWEFELVYPPNDTVVALVTLWHGSKDQTVMQAGQKKLNQSNGPDEDAVKKAVTDGLTKCLSYLGFNADVFLGKFDDNKYVQSLVNEKAKPEWKGPLNKTKFKEAMSNLGKDINDCTELLMLRGLVEDNVCIINQCKVDKPSWYFGEGDIKGLEEIIEDKQLELKDS